MSAYKEAPAPKFEPDDDLAIRARILREAERIITQDRQDQYGNAENCFEDIAGLWTVYFNRTFTADDVAIAMVLLKVARIKANPAHNDSYVDAAGYVALGGEIVAAALRKVEL